MASKEPLVSDPDDWYISCSDDEKYTSSGCSKGHLKWSPNPEDMVRLYQALDKEDPSQLQLEWKCPYGRRPRTPSNDSEDDEDEEDDDDLMADEDPAASSAANVSNFDFDADADETTPRRPPPGSRLTGSASRELKGSARKVTTNLSSILSKMERNRLKDAREVAAANAASNATPKGQTKS